MAGPTPSEQSGRQWVFSQLHMSAEHLASEASQEYFLAFGKRREEHASKCAGVRHMRGPALHLPPQIFGNWSVSKALWGF